VIAELDTRTDLAGEGLEMMAEQLLTLSRLMGGDAKSTTREVTRLFNRFGLSAEESSDMLDLLFRAAQASGAEVDRLATDVTKNAGALMEMGLSLEESVALFALFEREGIRSETVVRSLRSSFQRLTADGRPLRDSLADIFTELQTLDREAAVAKGLDIFGSQALELIDAVRDGRLSVEDFTQTLLDGSETILGVAGDTDGWREKLAELKNFLKLTFEPIAREVFKNVTEFVDALRPAAQRVVEAFEKDGLQGALEQVAIEWDRIYQDQLKPLWEDKFVPFLQDTVKPLVIETGIAIGQDFAKAIWNAFAGWFADNWPRLSSELFSRLTPSGLATNLLRNTVVPRLPAFDYSGPIGGSSGARSSSAPRPSVSSGNQYVEYAPGLFARAFATGGIVSSPTLGMVGEAGPEAIIPLDRAGVLGDTFVINVSGALDAEGVARQIEKILRDSRRRTGGVLV
jgi:hypothetical protein